MFALKDAGFADIIGQYLVNLAKTDSALDAQVLKKHKMLQRCLDYVTQKAYNIALEGAKKKGERGQRKIPRCIPRKQRSRKKSISARKNQKIPGRCPCLT